MVKDEEREIKATGAPSNGSVHVDPARLAALLDGRLGAEDAATLRAELAQADDDTLGAYADAVAIAGELQEPVVIPIETRRKPRRWILPGFVAAAAAIALVFVQTSRHDAIYAPSVYAVSTSGDGLPPVWGITRGSVATLSPEARAVRLGALLVDWEAVSANDIVARAKAQAVASLLEEIPGGNVVAQPLRNALGTPQPISQKSRAEFGESALRLVDEDRARIGAYLEGARAAAANGNTTYFDAPAHSIGALDKVNQSAYGADANAASERLRSLMQATPRDATAIRGAAEDLLRVLTR